MEENTKEKAKTEKVETKEPERFAVIKISGVQLKVYEGKEYEINKIDGNKGDKLDIDEVLLVADGDKVSVGTPFVDGAKVKLEITSQKKGEKINGFVYKSKSRHRRKYGFRPLITRVKVSKIQYA